MSEADHERLLNGFNATGSDYPGGACVHTLFEAQVGRTPEALAAAFGDATLTYRELDCRANQLAHYLRTRVPDASARIGVLVDRSLDMLVSLLAVLKAGYAYVPLDPRHPAARLRLILADAEVAAVIASDEAANGLLPTGATVIRPDYDHAVIAAQPSTARTTTAASDHLAYVIYTSGSTGTPKGVEITHRSVVNLLCAMAKAPGLQGSDVFLAVTTIAFDIAGLELFLPLSVGARVEIAAPHETSDGFALLARLQHSGATAVQATPSAWQMLLEAGFRPSPTVKMLCGGEKLSRNLADKLLDGGGELWNMYGPTETTIWSSTVRVQPGSDPITVGYPIANTTFHVVDDNGQLAPLGASGELWIGGDGLARGYFNRPDLTTEKFVLASFPGAVSKARYYRTGDVARRLPDGQIQVLGRTDQQIKLRGFRIELGEIEEALSRVPGVTACAVVLDATHGSAARLVAYYVEAGGGVTLRPDALRQELGQRLPDYMVPAQWVRMDSMPLNPNGKVDRRALPQPDLALLTQPRDYMPPCTPAQQALASIWQDVLQIERIGLTDNLFDLGADSIHLFQITARSVQAGIPISASQLLKNPTIGRLSELLVAESPVGAESLGSGPSLRSFQRSRRRSTAQESLGNSG
jgi:amino acid adenylation domain-containing protein